MRQITYEGILEKESRALPDWLSMDFEVIARKAEQSQIKQ